MNILTECNVEVVEHIGPTNLKDAKTEFFKDQESVNPTLIAPNFEYGKLNIDDVLGKIEELEKTSERIKSMWNPEEKLVLDKFLQNILEKLRFLSSTYMHQHANIATGKIASYMHRESNQKLYGYVDKYIFYTLLSEQLAKLAKPSSKEDSELHAYLLAQLGEIATCKAVVFVPQDETVKKFGAIAEKHMERILSYIPDEQQNIDMPTTYQVFKAIVDNELAGSSFEVELTGARNNLAVSQIERRIKVPEVRAKGNFTTQTLRELTAHEIGVHTMRSVKFEKCPIKLLSVGLPGYDAAEEGIAVCTEQAIRGKFQTSGVDHYINLGLATFMDKSFREIYNIRMAMAMLKVSSQNETAEERARRFQAARDLEFNRTMRALRGTNILPENSQLMYFNGPQMVWQWIEKHIEEPEEIIQKLYLSGKTDFLNPDHMWLIEQVQTP